MKAEMAMNALPTPQSAEEAMQLMQLSNMAPTVAPVANNYIKDTQQAETPVDEAVWQRRIHPKHRKAVRQFFQKDL